MLVDACFLTARGTKLEFGEGGGFHNFRGGSRIPLPSVATLYGTSAICS